VPIREPQTLRSPWKLYAEQLNRVMSWLLITNDHDTISISEQPAEVMQITIRRCRRVVAWI
jgi:hypothetical protein